MEKIFVVLAGPVTAEKKFLCNRSLVEWQTNVKKQRPSGDGCPYYSPASTNTNIRVFFATAKNQYGWQLTLEDVSGFNGSLAGVLKVLYAKRSKEWVSGVLMTFFYCF